MSRIQQSIEKRNQKLQERLDPTPFVSATPIFSNAPREYEISDKVTALHCGGIGLVLELAKKIELASMLDKSLNLLKIHQPYHESDHVLNMAYNIICGGDCLEDLELLRNDEAYLNAMGVQRIPDPTTAGDFLRRFGYDDIMSLMDVMNDANSTILRLTGRDISRTAILDIDSKVAETYGECKERMNIAYTGVWGFHPLVITEANAGIHVCIVNRSGNEASQQDAGKWIDKSIDKVLRNFDHVCLRGDSAFSLTAKFDEWDENGVGFCFGYDNTANLREIAANLPKNSWEIKRYDRRERQRKPKPRVKEQQVVHRGYRNLRTEKEFIAEFDYRPTKCQKIYRIVVLKKNIKVTSGQTRLFDEVKYLFYITNIADKSASEILEFIRGRCNHENKIEQLTNGVHALKMPAAEFRANWAYMLIAAIAWNLKSWIGLLFHDAEQGDKIIRMEFKSFIRGLIFIPCQILVTGRYIVFRFLNVNRWLANICTSIGNIRTLQIMT